MSKWEREELPQGDVSFSREEEFGVDVLSLKMWDIWVEMVNGRED